MSWGDYTLVGFPFALSYSLLNFLTNHFSPWNPVLDWVLRLKEKGLTSVAV